MSPPCFLDEKTTQHSEVSTRRITTVNLFVRDGHADKQTDRRQQAEQWRDTLTRLTLHGQLVLWCGARPDSGPGPSF